MRCKSTINNEIILGKTIQNFKLHSIFKDKYSNNKLKNISKSHKKPIIHFENNNDPDNVKDDRSEIQKNNNENMIKIFGENDNKDYDDNPLLINKYFERNTSLSAKIKRKDFIPNIFDIIFLKIHDNFFPKCDNKFIQKDYALNDHNIPDFESGGNEIDEIKHYDSDTDITNMRKFVYEKLDGMHNEMIIKCRKKKKKKRNDDKKDIEKNISKKNLKNPKEKNKHRNFVKGDKRENLFENFNQINNNNVSSDDMSKINNTENNNENTNSYIEESSISNTNSPDLNIEIDENNIFNNKDHLHGELMNKYSKKDNNINFGKNKNNHEVEVESFERLDYKKSTFKQQEFSKKSHITSIFYYDWSKDVNKYEVPYYFYTTPIMRLNENNIPTVTNPLDEMKTMNFDNLMQLGKFNLMHIPYRFHKLFRNSKIFIYDQYTAIPFVITDLRSLNNNNNKNLNDLNINYPINDSNIIKYNDIENDTNIQNCIDPCKENMKISPIQKKVKLLVIVINDFYDCFTNHYDLIIHSLGIYSR